MSFTVTPDRLRFAALVLMMVLSLMVSALIAIHPRRVLRMPYGFVMTLLLTLIAGLTAAVLFSVREGL